MTALDLVPISFGTGSNPARYGLAGITQFENAYIHDLGEEAKVSFSAFAINGCEELATVGGDSTAIIRSLFNLDGVLLVVCGRLLYSTNEAGDTPALIGGIPSDGFVTMARNRQATPQVMIVCDGLWFVYQGGTLTQGTDPDLPPPIAVVEMNGYFVLIIQDGRWFITDIDAVTVDALDFTSADSNADGNVMGARRGSELLIMGGKTTQFYRETGSGDFPFAHIQTIDVGCYAAGSVANVVTVRGGIADTVVWAATDSKGAYSSIVILNGYNAEPISTDEVDRLIRNEPDPSSIRSMAWQESGHSYYAIMGTSFTRVWDAKTGKWHSRKSFNEARWRMSCHAHVGSTVVFGDFETNKLYRSDESLLDEDGNPIVWTIVSPNINAGPYRFKLPALSIDMVTGVGVAGAADHTANPELMIDYTKDGGASYAALRLASLGAEAQRNVHITQRGYGNFDKNGVSFRLRCSANVVKALMGMHVAVKRLKAA